MFINPTGSATLCMKKVTVTCICQLTCTSVTIVLVEVNVNSGLCVQTTPLSGSCTRFGNHHAAILLLMVRVERTDDSPGLQNLMKKWKNRKLSSL